MLSNLLKKVKLVYGLFGQSKMHSKLDFYPKPARNETNLNKIAAD